MELSGGCHCGNIEAVFSSRAEPDALAIRSCQCSFCRKHGVRTVTDANGRVSLHVHDASSLARYVFGLHAAEFFVCTRCGVYVAAVLETDTACVSTLNINVLEAHPFGTRGAEPADYSAEDEAGRRARRLRVWTPTEVRVQSA